MSTKEKKEPKQYGVFVLDDDYSYSWKCTGMYPGKDGPQEICLKVEFKYLTEKRLKEIQKEVVKLGEQYLEMLRSGDSDDKEREAAKEKMENHNAVLMREAIIGWGDDSGFWTNDGQPVPFSPEALERALRNPWSLEILVNGFKESRTQSSIANAAKN